MSGIFFRYKNYMTSKIRQREVKLLLKEPFLRILKILKMIKLTIIIKIVPENCNIEKLVDFASSPRNNVIQLHQIKSEIIKLLEIIRASQPKTMLELGTFNGGTLFLFSRIANKDALLISIDLPKVKFGNFQFDWRVPLIKRFSLPNQKLKLIRANSHKTSTLYQVKKILDGKKLDFMFIDADHSYDGVKKDFEMYSPLVKNGGVIAFHDIVPSPCGSIDTVHKFWKQIKNQFHAKEIIENVNQAAGGIGVIKK